MITVDKSKCVGCKLCMTKCPFGAITFPDKYPKIGDECNACGACVETCPVKALTLSKADKKIEGNWTGVAVFGEQKDGIIQPIVYELLGKARELADKLKEKVYCVILADKIDKPERLIEYGADKIYLYEHPKLAKYNSETYASILTKFISETRPNIMLIGATNTGRELAPRTSTRMRAGLTADCTYLDINEDRLLLQTRPAFGGNIMASIVSPTARPQMASVRYKVMDKPEPKKRSGEVVKMKVDEKLLSGPIEVVEEKLLPQGDDIANANVIVAGGKGIGKKDGFIMIHNLAAILGGSVAASRAAIEAAWADYPIQVGLSGKVVKPELYIACGISGAIQHTAGMETSKIVVAINKDENAPIFNIADYGIIGDINEILPEIIAEIKKRKHPSK